MNPARQDEACDYLEEPDAGEARADGQQRGLAARGGRRQQQQQCSVAEQVGLPNERSLGVSGNGGGVHV